MWLDRSPCVRGKEMRMSDLSYNDFLSNKNPVATYTFIDPIALYASWFAEALREGLFLQPWAEDEIHKIETDFVDWRKQATDLSKPIILPDGRHVPRVPQTTRWLIKTGRFIGLCGIRHFLTESLTTYGGHIGYAVRASERRKGLGRLLLQEAVRVAKELELDEVILTCNEDNYGSIRIIESCGGKLHRSVALPFRSGPHNIYKIHL